MPTTAETETPLGFGVTASQQVDVVLVLKALWYAWAVD